MIEVETPEVVTTTTDTNIVVETTNIPAEVIDLGDLDITIAKKEYVIVGDSIYIPQLYDDAPQWMKDLVQLVVDVSVETNNQGLINEMNSVLDQFAVSYVPLNQYTQSILDLGNEDSRINALIETLNSNYNDGLSEANAQIISLQNTKASKDEVVSQVIQTIAAQLADDTSNIGATVKRIDQAIANESSSRALSFEVLTASLEDTDLGVAANASATQALNVYVGLDTTSSPNGTGLLADVEILQKQNDGVIETITGTYDVMLNPQDPNLAELVLTAEPYVSWKASDVTGIDTRLRHIGDVYIKYSVTANGAREYIGSYKFIRTIPDAVDAYKSTDVDGFTWALVVDQAAQDAYSQALNAYDLADSKRRVFTTTPTVPYDTGDLWIRDISGSKQIWRATGDRSSGSFTLSEWVIASTDDTAVTALQTGLANGTTTIKLTNAYVGTVPLTTYLSSEIDGKVGVYSGTTAPVAEQPSGVAVNDIYLWFTTQSASGKTYDITRTYKYNGSAWVEITTNDDITNLADLADGKRTIFGGVVVPTGAVDRDIWIPSANNGSYVKGEIYQYLSGVWGATTRYTADITSLSENVQAQIDGKVDTYYQDTVPFANATNVTRKPQAGDYWYCTQDGGIYLKGKIYKYVESANGSNYNYTWTLTTDISRDAFDLADGKSTIYTTASQPTKYNMNDMMIVVSSFNNGTTTFSDGVVLTATADSSSFIASHWVKKINDTEDLDAYKGVVNPQLTSLQNQVDGKIESWYTASTSDPKAAWTDAQTRAKHDGDMWYQTDTKLSYYYSSTTNSWNLIDDAKAIQALEDAATAQATADGKISSYYMSTLADAQTMSTAWSATEKTNNVGDLVVVWNDGTLDNNGTWRWNGTSWITTRDKKLVALASDVTALSTELDNGTNTWASADSTLENSLMTEITDEGARVESKFAYNSIVGINGIYKKSGFGLTTNYISGAGTQANPYVSEFWIDATKLRFTNSANTGRTAPFTIDASGATPQITFNGKVSFENVSDTQGSGTNLLYNSAPKIGNETKGWSIGWSNHGLSSSISSGFDPWRPAGGASVYVVVPGSPGIGTVFDINNSRFPVMANTRYEASAYLSSHRCDSRVTLAWFDINGNYINESSGTSNSSASSGPLVGWSRSTMFATAPSNAATAQFYVRSVVTSTDPYCFVAYAYAGIASTNQTIPSNWSEGSSAGVSSGDVVAEINNGLTTTINGGRITTGSITANQVNLNNLFAQNITYTGVITGGNVAGGGIIQSYNGKMRIDLVNGSIYIQ